MTDRARQLTLRIYCKNDEPLLDQTRTNTFAVTVGMTLRGSSMKRSAKPRLAKIASAERAFAIVEAGITEIVAEIAKKRPATRHRRPRAA